MPKMVRHTPVSLKVIGILGRATAQAVHKCSNRRVWIDTRLHRILLPDTEGLDANTPVEVVKMMAAEWKRMSPVIQSELVALPTERGLGRPPKSDPQDLADWLGVSCGEGDSLWRVYSRHVNLQFKKLVELAKGFDGNGTEFARHLHVNWLPRHMRRRR